MRKAGVAEEAGAALVLFLGVTILRLLVSGGYTALVRPSLGPLLAISGPLLVGVGAWGLWRARSARHDGHGREGHGHEGHAHAAHAVPAVALLLAVPILAVALVPATPLGASAANRGARVVRGSAHPFPALPAHAAGVPLPMRITDAVDRVTLDSSHSLDGVPIELVGFVRPAADGSGFLLTRFAVSCCAADATPSDVLVQTTDDSVHPVNGDWVDAVGTVVPGGADPVFTATSITVVPTPSDPYE